MDIAFDAFLLRADKDIKDALKGVSDYSSSNLISSD